VRPPNYWFARVPFQVPSGAVCVHLYPEQNTYTQNVHFSAKNSELIKLQFCTLHTEQHLFCYVSNMRQYFSINTGKQFQKGLTWCGKLHTITPVFSYSQCIVIEKPSSKIISIHNNNLFLEAAQPLQNKWEHI
jgi:hypothetical protein